MTEFSPHSIVIYPDILICLQIPILDIAGGPFPDTARAKSTAYPQQLHGCQVDFAVSCRKDAERPWTYRALDAAAIAAPNFQSIRPKYARSLRS